MGGITNTIDCDLCGSATVHLVDGELAFWYCQECDGHIVHREFCGSEMGSGVWTLSRVLLRAVRRVIP